MAWFNLYVKAVNESKCGVVPASAIASAFGVDSFNASVALSQSIVPMLADGKLASGTQKPAYVFAAHILVRGDRYNGSTPVSETIAKAWYAAGFRDAQKFGGGTPDKPKHAAAWLKLLAEHPTLANVKPIVKREAKVQAPDRVVEPRTEEATNNVA